MHSTISTLAPVATAKAISTQHSVWMTSIRFTLVTVLLLGLGYPLLVTGIASLIFPHQAGGSLILKNGQVIGSELLAQSFTSDRYFHPRPSAAGMDGYDPTSSGGSNLGPTNQKLIDAVQQRAVAYRQENGLAPDAQVPVDAITASASGLDPDISPANAYLQAARVAKARGLSASQVKVLIDQSTQGRTLGILGEPRMNVLELNLALDATSK